MKKKYTKEQLLNTCMKSVNPEDGPKIVQFYKDAGFITRAHQGLMSEKDGNSLIYYGVDKSGYFNNRSIKNVKYRNMTILPIPTEDEPIQPTIKELIQMDTVVFPCMIKMEVRNSDEENWRSKNVVGKFKGFYLEKGSVEYDIVKFWPQGRIITEKLTIEYSQAIQAYKEKFNIPDNVEIKITTPKTT